MSRPFFGGVPTGPDVEKLKEAFDIQKGQIVPYEEIAKVIGVGYGTNRFESVVKSWQSIIFRDKGIESIREGCAVCFLTADQAQNQTRARIKRIGKASGRNLVKTSVINPLELSSEQKREEHSILKRESIAIHEFVSKSFKQIVLPPVSGQPLRIAQE